MQRLLAWYLHLDVYLSVCTFAWQFLFTHTEMPGIFPERGYQISLYENNGQYIINFFLRLIFFYVF